MWRRRKEGRRRMPSRAKSPINSAQPIHWFAIKIQQDYVWRELQAGMFLDNRSITMGLHSSKWGLNDSRHEKLPISQLSHQTTSITHQDIPDRFPKFLEWRRLSKLLLLLVTRAAMPRTSHRYYHTETSRPVLNLQLHALEISTVSLRYWHWWYCYREGYVKAKTLKSTSLPRDNHVHYQISRPYWEEGKIIILYINIQCLSAPL